MAIFGRPNFQADVNSLFPQGNSAAGTPDMTGGMPPAGPMPSWLGTPIDFILSALSGGINPAASGGLSPTAPPSGGIGKPTLTTPRAPASAFSPDVIVGGLGGPVPSMPGISGTEGGPALPTGAEGPTPSVKLPSGFGRQTGKSIFGEPTAVKSSIPPPPMPGSAVPTGGAPGTFSLKGELGKRPIAGTGTGAGATTYSVGPNAPAPYSPNYMGGTHKFEGTGANPRSSAYGPGQFIDSTFRSYLKDVHPELANVSKAELQPLKAKFGADATDWYARQNAPILASANIPVNDATLHAAHFLGPAGAKALYSAPDDTPVAKVLKHDAIAANPEVLSGQTVGQVKARMEKDMMSPGQAGLPPMPPTVPGAPNMAQTPQTNFGGVREMLDKASTITPDENTASILAGLAKGAGSVASNSPGSFAAALAAAGAGGEAARAGGLKETREAAFKRAEAEVPLLKTEREQQKDFAEVNYNNQLGQYKVALQNLQNNFEGKTKQFEFTQPKFEHDANGMYVKQYNAQTGNTDITFQPTKQIFDTAEHIKQMAEAAGMGGEVAQQFEFDAAMKAAPPQAQAGIAKRLAIRQILRNGGGATVFPAGVFQKYQKEAEAEVDAQMGPGANLKPQERQQAINRVLEAKLANDPHTDSDRTWVDRGANIAPAAQTLKMWLDQAKQPPAGAPPATTPAAAPAPPPAQPIPTQPSPGAGPQLNAQDRAALDAMYPPGAM